MTKKQGFTFGYLDTDNYPVSRLIFLSPFNTNHLLVCDWSIHNFYEQQREKDHAPAAFVFPHALYRKVELEVAEGSDALPYHPRTSLGFLTLIEHYGSDNFYLGYVADCISPHLYLILADSEDDAYEYFVNYAAKNLGLAIELSEYKDYLDKEHHAAYDALTTDTDRHNFFGQHYDGSISSDGQPVDTELVNIHKLTLARIDFITTEQKQD